MIPFQWRKNDKMLSMLQEISWIWAFKSYNHYTTLKKTETTMIKAKRTEKADKLK